MPVFFGVIVAVVLVVAAIVLLGVWGFPFSLVVVALLVGYLVAAQKKDDRAGTFERGRRTEPTGMPRKSSTDADTANERVGQA